MDCEQYQEALSASALDAESGAEVQAFRLHLEVCEACRRELVHRREFLASVDRQLVVRCEAVPSGDFNARLRRRISDEPRQVMSPSLRGLPIFAGAAALLVVLALFHFSSVGTARSHDSNPVSTASSAEKPTSGVPSVDNSPAPARENRVADLNPSEQISFHPISAIRRSSPEFKVRIDHQELYAVVRLTQAVADGRVNTAALLDSQQQPEEPVAAKPLEIPPLELRPMEESASEIGAAER
jgi:hypothetical protein